MYRHGPARRLGRAIGRTGAAAAVDACGGGRGCGQRLARQQDGADRTGGEVEARGRWRDAGLDPHWSGLSCVLPRAWSFRGRQNALRARAFQRPGRCAQLVPVHLVPVGRRLFHRAAVRDAVRAVDDRPPAHAPGQGPADPHGRTTVPPRQARHADHGRPADPDRRARVDPVVGQLAQCLRLDGARRDARLRRHRLLRRLPEGIEALRRRLLGQGAARPRDRRGGGGDLRFHAPGPGAALGHRRTSVHEGPAARPRAILHPVRHRRHRRLRQCGQPD